MKKSNVFNDIKQQRDAGVKSRNHYVQGSDYTKQNVIDNTDANCINKNVGARYERTKKKAATTSDYIKKLATIVGASVLGIVGVKAIVPSGTKATFEEVYAYETGVYYSVHMDNYDDDVYVVLYNDFTNREEKVNEQSQSGVFEHLASNMYYTLAVKKGNRMLTKQQIYTKTERQTKENYDEPASQDPTNNNQTSGN